MAVLDHYENSGDRNLLSRAYYYAGSVAYDLGDAPAGVEYFQRAMDALADTTDLQFRSALNFRIGFLLLDQCVYEPSLEYFKTSYMLEQQRKDTLMMIYCLEKQAFAFGDSHFGDSALYYFDKAKSLAETLKDSVLVKRISASMASYYLEINNYAKADNCLRPYLKYVNHIDKIPFYSMMAEVCINTGRYEEAYPYCVEMLEKGTLYSRMNACRLLIEYHLARNDVRNASRYIDLYDKYTDSVRVIEAADVVARMNASYNYSNYKTKAANLEVENARANMWKMLYGSLAFVLAALLIVGLLWVRKRAKAREMRFEILKRDMAEHSDAHIRELEGRMAELQLKLGEAERHGAQQAQQLVMQQAQLEALVDMANRRRSIRTTIKERLAGSSIYMMVRDAAAAGAILSDAAWDELDSFVNELIPGFKASLYGISKLSKQDYHLCLLIRLGGLSGTDMATVMGRTKSAVSKAKTKLQERFIGSGREAGNLDDFIASL